MLRGLCNENGALGIQDHNLSKVGFIPSKCLVICLLGLASSRLLEILTKICGRFYLDLFLSLLLVFVMLRSSLGLVVILIILCTLCRGLSF
jgi:hypothetical protein